MFIGYLIFITVRQLFKDVKNHDIRVVAGKMAIQNGGYQGLKNILYF